MASKKKVIQNYLYEEPLIEEKDKDRIVRVIEILGGNLCRVELPRYDENNNFVSILCSIPSKFSKKIWIKRGRHRIYLFQWK